MATIKQEDFVQSLADGLQFISYFHPKDYVDALAAAWEQEESPAAKDAMAQILVNSRMCAEGHRPICQDTGMVVAFVKVGMETRFDDGLSLQAMIDEGVRRAYTDVDNPLRASVLADPAGARRNTRDNTPAVVYAELVPGATLDVRIAAKGGGSENKARFAVLNPSDSVVDWVLRQLPDMGAGWCPPGILGIGIGGSPEKALLLAKEALFEPIDIQDLRARGPANRIEALRLELMDKVNALGIGAQGLGGLTTVLDVKIRDYPTHAASLPVGLIPNCAATRHIHFTLDGSGPARFVPPPLSAWPEVAWDGPAGARRIDLDRLTRADVATWRAGERLLLSGRLLSMVANLAVQVLIVRHLSRVAKPLRPCRGGWREKASPADRQYQSPSAERSPAMDARSCGNCSPAAHPRNPLIRCRLVVLGHQCRSICATTNSVPSSCATNGFMRGLYIVSVMSRIRTRRPASPPRRKRRSAPTAGPETAASCAPG